MTDEGAASILLLAATVVTALLLVAATGVGQYLTARVMAATAADAAALAAAPVTFRPFGARGSPAAEAARFAALNGTRLVRCRCPIDPSWSPRQVEVEVQREVDVVLLGRRYVNAVSRARFTPTRLLGDS